MDMHGASYRRVGRAGAHHIDDTVDRLVRFDAEERCPKDFLRFPIDQDVHESLGLAALAGTADARHRAPTDKNRAPRRASLALRHSRARQRRIRK